MDRTKGRTEVTYEPSHRNSAVKRTTVKFEWVSQAHFRYFYILTSGVVLGVVHCFGQVIGTFG